jgi:hypothetical protein
LEVVALFYPSSLECFGINMGGMLEAVGLPYASTLFSGVLVSLVVILIATGSLCLGSKKPIPEEHVAV